MSIIINALSKTEIDVTLKAFAVNSYALTQEHKAFLKNELYWYIHTGISLVAEGMTSRSGSYEHNRTLSEKRVKAVENFIGKEFGKLMSQSIKLFDSAIGVGEDIAARSGVKDKTESAEYRAVRIYSKKSLPDNGPLILRVNLKSRRYTVHSGSGVREINSGGFGARVANSATTLYNIYNGNKNLYTKKHELIHANYSVTEVIKEDTMIIRGGSADGFITISYRYGPRNDQAMIKFVEIYKYQNGNHYHKPTRKSNLYDAKLLWKKVQHPNY